MNVLDWPDQPALAQFGPASWQSRVLAALVGVFVRPVLALLTGAGMVAHRVAPGLLQRARLDLLDRPLRVLRPLPGTRLTAVSLPDCPAEWVVAPGPGGGTSRVIIYFPGSAVVTPGLNSHRRFASILSASTGAQVLYVGYRLAPRVGITAAVADGLAAYRRALAQGHSPHRIVLAGDSAGGLVAAKTAIAIRDAGLPVPAGQVLLSPLACPDLDPKRRTAKRPGGGWVPFSTVKFIRRMLTTGSNDGELSRQPRETDLRGLGPFLLQAGTDETFVDDTMVLAEQLAAARVPAWVQVWHKAPHMFQLSFDVNPDARRAMTEIAAFVAYATTVHDEASA